MADRSFNVADALTGQSLGVRLADNTDGTFSVAVTGLAGGGGGVAQTQVRNVANDGWVNVGLGIEGATIAHMPVRIQGTGANVVEPANAAPGAGDYALPVRNIPSGTQAVQGAKTSGDDPGATNLGVLSAIANAAAPSLGEGKQVGLSVDLAGSLRVASSGGSTNLAQYGGVAVGATNAVHVQPGTGAVFAVSGTFWQATQPVSATALPLPTGAATAANQTTEIAALGAPADVEASGDGSLIAILKRLRTLLGTLNLQTDGLETLLNGGLPAALTAGGNLKTAVQEALPAGGNNIGDVDVLTVPSDPFGANADAAAAAGGTGTIQAKLRRVTQGLEDLKTLIVLAAGANLIGKAQVRNAANSADIDPVAEGTFTGRINTQGQKTMAGSTPVVLPSDQAAIPVTASAGTNLNTSALALEAGNLATLAAKDFATSAKQDTGNASLASIDTSTARLPIAPGAASSGAYGLLAQGVVSDTPSSFSPETVQPISLTPEGRVRVSAVIADIDRVWNHTFDSPWGQTSPWAGEAW